MTEAELLKIVDAHIARSETWIQEKIGRERAVAYDLYYGRPLGDEVDGRSQVISHDVAQAVDSSLPQLIKMFAGSDRAVEFTPRGPEDVEMAEQATDGANYVFWTQNNGYLIVHNALKDGLLVKTGALKWCWEKETKTVEETYLNLDEASLMQLSQDPQAEIVEGTENGDGTYSVKVRRKKESGKVKIYNIPPEELLIEPQSASCLVEDIPFICHAPMKTLSDLVEMGYDREDIESSQPEDDDRLFTDERIARNLRTNALSIADASGADDIDPAQRRYRYYECYLMVDSDGDGVSELRKVCKIGSKILHDEATDHVPIGFWTPKVMPHEPIGMSMADDVADQQILATVLWRQSLDNIYLSNAPRTFVQGEVNLDDLLQVRPGGIVRGQPGSSLTPIVVPYMAGETFQMLEYVKQETESRTGVARYIQGFDPDSLNQTKGGMQILQNNAQARLDTYGRNFAECLLKPLFRGILYLMAKHQQAPLLARLRNKFVPIDPRAWTTEYDMTVNVGLGSGSKDQQMAHLSNIISLQMQMSQSPYAAMVPPKQVYNTVAKLTENAGFKDPAQHWRDPSQPPEEGEQPWPPQPGPPPELQKAQMQIEADKEKFAAESQMKQAEMQQEGQLQREEAQMDMALEKLKAQMDMQLEYFKAKLDAEVKERVGMMTAHAHAMNPGGMDGRHQA